MIVLKDDNIIEIPNYDDLDNKPKINGVVLEGNKTTTQLGLNVDLSGFYTKAQSDDRFQPKGNYQPAGNYLTSIPSDYVTEGELNDALAAQLNSKQDTLVSGTNIKTINGNSILGSGDLTITGGTTDLSNYYTKTESDNKFQEKGNYLTAVPSEYVTETELNNTLNQKDYATKSYVDTQVGNINTILENIIG